MSRVVIDDDWKWGWRRRWKKVNGGGTLISLLPHGNVPEIVFILGWWGRRRRWRWRWRRGCRFKDNFWPDSLTVKLWNHKNWPIIRLRGGWRCVDKVTMAPSVVSLLLLLGGHVACLFGSSYNGLLCFPLGFSTL